MRNGPLRHRLALQSPANSQDSTGQVTQVFSTYATAWGSVQPFTGRELLSAQQTQSLTTHRIRLRYTAALEPTHRIVFRGRTFEIDNFINPKEIGQSLELLCREVN